MASKNNRSKRIRPKMVLVAQDNFLIPQSPKTKKEIDAKNLEVIHELLRKAYREERIAAYNDYDIALDAAIAAEWLAFSFL